MDKTINFRTKVSTPSKNAAVGLGDPPLIDCNHLLQHAESRRQHEAEGDEGSGVIQGLRHHHFRRHAGRHGLQQLSGQSATWIDGSYGCCIMSYRRRARSCAAAPATTSSEAR